MSEQFPDDDRFPEDKEIAPNETGTNHFLDKWREAFEGSEERAPYSVYQPVVSKFHQMGKTSYALRCAEVVTDKVLGQKFDPDNISFDLYGFMQRRMTIPKYSFQVLDEPQTVASSRTWHDQEQNDLAEMLMTTNREIKPVLFPCPLTSMIDNRIFDVSTSQVSVVAKGKAIVYAVNRDLLNRRGKKVWTPKLMYLKFKKPSAELWGEYTRRFADYRDKRMKAALERVQAIEKEAGQVKPALYAEDLVPLILADTQRFIGRDGSLSQSKIEAHFGVPYNRANKAKALAMRELETKERMENAEKAE